MDSLPDETLIPIIKPYFREIIVSVCKRWHSLAAAAKCKSAKVARANYFQPELYSWFAPKIYCIGEAIEAKNWDALIHSMLRRRCPVTPEMEEEAIILYIDQNYVCDVDRIITEFPERVPKIPITKIYTIKEAAQYYHDQGFLLINSPLLRRLLDDGETTAAAVAHKYDERQDNLAFTVDSILKILETIGGKGALGYDDEEDYFHAVWYLAWLCRKLIGLAE